MTESLQALLDLWEDSDECREHRLARAWLDGARAEVYAAAKDAARNSYGVVDDTLVAVFMARIETRARRIDAWNTKYGIYRIDTAYRAARDCWLVEHGCPVEELP
jgi:hypothetical protein